MRKMIDWTRDASSVEEDAARQSGVYGQRVAHRVRLLDSRLLYHDTHAAASQLCELTRNWCGRSFSQLYTQFSDYLRMREAKACNWGKMSAGVARTLHNPPVAAGIYLQLFWENKSGNRAAIVHLFAVAMTKWLWCDVDWLYSQAIEMSKRMCRTLNDAEALVTFRPALENIFVSIKCLTRMVGNMNVSFDTAVQPMESSTSI